MDNQQQSGLNNPLLGTKTTTDPYPQTRETIGSKTEQRKIAREEKKLARDLKYGRVTERTKQAEINKSINEFINKTIAEKMASLNAGNTSATARQEATSVSVSSSSSPDTSIPSAIRGTKGGGGGNKGIVYTLDICVDDIPHKLDVLALGEPYILE